MEREPRSKSSNAHPKRGLLVAIGLLVPTMVVACSSTDVSPEADAAPALADASPSRDGRAPAPAIPDAGPRNLPCAIESLLSRHCLECHDGSLDLPRLVTHEDLASRHPTLTDRTLAEVALGKMTAERSPMPPPPRDRVSPSDVATFQAWIESGSPRAACPEPPSLDAGATDASRPDASGDASSD
jgi:hypothetical protein